MRFWDASALVTLVLEQPRSSAARQWAREDGDIVAWWGSTIECTSAIARLHREGVLTADDERLARRRLEALSAGWYEVQPGTTVRDLAMRLLRVHALRAADALQLAAALEWAGGSASGAFVTFDDRLRDAAAREGFSCP